MRPLDISVINQNAPYKVYFDGTSYCFVSQGGATISIGFSLENEYSYTIGYWLGLDNSFAEPSAKDDNIRETVFCIIEEFFKQNPYYLLYFCEFHDGKQHLRNRMFRSWFTNYTHSDLYHIHTKDVVIKGNETYLSIIVPKSHPDFEDIINYFDEVVAIMKSGKP
ncbi:MAG: hypothetical protein IJR07_04395 [Bacteroidaceae bacterium]|nr:hypothetical protein [Bacteroidaceae bacterium]